MINQLSNFKIELSRLFKINQPDNFPSSTNIVFNNLNKNKQINNKSSKFKPNNNNIDNNINNNKKRKNKESQKIEIKIEDLHIDDEKHNNSDYKKKEIC